MKKILVAIGIAAFLTACASKDPAKDTPVVDRSQNTAVTPATNPNTAQTNQVKPTPSPAINPLKDPGSPLSKRVIYFDYNKDAVKAEYAQLLQAHATFLSQNRGRKIRLEGHADERGTREYNISLSARRATATREFLIAQGVQGDRISSIAYGKERPVATCDSEQCWSQNRRAVTVITGGAKTS